jgi:hypothetical protein
MNPDRNPTKYTLETMEHHMRDIIQDTMYKILDNGDRPDKRIDAIIGLHYAGITILRKLDTLNKTIYESA